MVSFRDYPDEVSSKRIAHAIEEGWHVCLQHPGSTRIIASYVFKLREDPTWSEDEIRAVMAGIRARLQEHGESISPDLN